MSELKVCPLMLMACKIAQVPKSTKNEIVCPGDNKGFWYYSCAWYDFENHQCAMLTLAQNMKGGREDGQKARPAE